MKKLLQKHILFKYSLESPNASSELILACIKNFVSSKTGVLVIENLNVVDFHFYFTFTFLVLGGSDLWVNLIPTYKLLYEQTWETKTHCKLQLKATYWRNKKSNYWAYQIEEMTDDHDISLSLIVCMYHVTFFITSLPHACVLKR